MDRVNYKRKLVNYFKKNLKKGYTEESLKWALIRQGYSKIMVENAIKELHKELSKDAPELKDKPVIRYEILDEHNNPVKIKKPWWKKFFG